MRLPTAPSFTYLLVINNNDNKYWLEKDKTVSTEKYGGKSFKGGLIIIIVLIVDLNVSYFLHIKKI